MLPLRTLLLLLLCLTSGMTATLGLYRSSSSEDTPAPEHPTIDTEAAGTPALDPAPVEPIGAERAVLTEGTPIAEALIGQEPPALEESVADQSDRAASDTPLENHPILNEPFADAPVSDSPLGEQPVKEDIHASDAADSLVAGEPVADNPLAEEPIADSPLAEEPVADSPLVEEPVADSPLFNNSPDVDAPAVEAHPAADTPDMAVLAEEAQGHNTPAAEEAPAGEALAEEAPGAELQDNEIEAIQKALQDLEDLGLEDLAPSMRLPKVEDSSWGINSIRNSFQTVNGYFDSLVELVGGRNGVCQFTCLYGKAPVPRTGYQIPEPNGCSNSLLGLQFDMGIPAMTKCCNMLDTCYDTCGNSKSRCDNKFRWCVHGICTDLKRSLGFVSKVQACESMADALYNTVWSLGCRSYMSSQREACYCEGQERDEL